VGNGARHHRRLSGMDSPDAGGPGRQGRGAAARRAPAAAAAGEGARLDRAGGVPLHVQVACAIRAELAGQPPGMPLPSEAALCARFGVARSVVRQALSGLVAEGAIRRDPGRAPVVAAPREHRRLVQRSAGLYDQFSDLGVALRTRVLACRAEPAPAEVAAFLGTADALLLERLRSVDGEPIAYVRTWLPCQAVPGLGAAELEDASLHRVLARRYGLRPGPGRNRIRAVGADAPLAEMLRVAAGSPLLMLEGQGRDQAGRPLEWFTTWHRPERLVFDVEVEPAQERVSAALRADGAPTVLRVAEDQAGARETGWAGGRDAMPADVRAGEDDAALLDLSAGTTPPSGDEALADAERALAHALQAVRRLRG